MFCYHLEKHYRTTTGFLYFNYGNNQIFVECILFNLFRDNCYKKQKNKNKIYFHNQIGPRGLTGCKIKFNQSANFLLLK